MSHLLIILAMLMSKCMIQLLDNDIHNDSSIIGRDLDWPNS
jgi:hypothetical protein